ncbi:large ribosomal subunit protein uL15y-like [Elaeis guineensis]|uniref:large ribosomal subunit protein uL15y-like n=1 Tax=Elaeis guineensis var. tenera TaxID=51953 RepID=UPI003C6D61FB
MVATVAATTTCIKKNRKYPRGRGNVGGMHHHHVLSDSYHPSTDHLWSLDPDDVKKPAIAYDGNFTPLTSVTPFNYFKILGRDVLTGQFRY